jgi:hypothetical protein
MGLTAECNVLCEGRTYRCKAFLEEREVMLRGELRLTLPFAEIHSVESDDERLVLNAADAAVTLMLGPSAGKWATKITHPRSLIDKLGVKQGHVVSVLGVDDPEFREQLRSRVSTFAQGAPAKNSDWVFVAMDGEEDLASLKTLKRSIKKTGAIWAFWRKGRKELTESHVREAAKNVGLVDVKVARVSEVLSGIKLMIPKDDR